MKVVLRFLMAGAVLGAAVGCKPPPSKVKLNNQMALALTDMGNAGTGFRMAITRETVLDDLKVAQVQVAGLVTARQRMADAVNKYKGIYADPDFALPADSVLSAELLKAFVTYLDKEQETVDKAGEIIQTLQDNQLKDNEKLAKIVKLMDQVRGMEKDAYADLDKAHKAFCEGNYYKPVAKLEDK